MIEQGRHCPPVTLAALYGAGLTVGRRVAERLGVPLLDREIPDARPGTRACPRMPSPTER